MLVLGDFLQYFSLNSSPNSIKSSFFTVFVDGFGALNEVRVVLSQLFLAFIGYFCEFFRLI
jgi:hypothetical protein